MLLLLSSALSKVKINAASCGLLGKKAVSEPIEVNRTLARYGRFDQPQGASPRFETASKFPGQSKLAELEAKSAILRLIFVQTAQARMYARCIEAATKQDTDRISE